MTRTYSARIAERDIATIIAWLEVSGKRPKTVSRAIYTAIRTLAQHLVNNGATYVSQPEADTILAYYQNNEDDQMPPLKIEPLETTEEGEDRARRFLEE